MHGVSAIPPSWAVLLRQFHVTVVDGREAVRPNFGNEVARRADDKGVAP